MRKLITSIVCLCSINLLHAQNVISIKPAEQVPVQLVRISPRISGLKMDLSKIEKYKAPENESVRKMMPAVNPNALPKGEDAALQKSYSNVTDEVASSSIQVLSNWTGLQVTSVEPSDNTLAVGLNHVVQMVNGDGTLVRVWNKSTGAILADTKVSGITGASNIGDPSIVYDAQADRYVLLVIGGNILFSANLTVCISKTNDPAGQYYVYRVASTYGILSSSFPDYPKMSVWGNSYFITTNGGGPQTWVLNRSAMIAGQTGWKAQRFNLKDFPGGGVQAASPVSVMGTVNAPASSDAIMMRAFDDAWTTGTDLDNLELYKMKIDWSNPNNSSMTGPLKLNIAAYDSYLCGNSLNASSCITQPGVSQKLDALGGIVYDKAQYRNFGTYESIVCSHLSDARGDGLGGIRWYELRKSGTNDWSLYQQGTYSPNDGSNRFLGSVSQNQDGTIALGYNISGTTLFPGIRITARNKTDVLGSMTAAETIVKSGSVSQTSSNRYGDYNGMICDPTDGSFWFTANYSPTGDWATNVVHFNVNASAPSSLQGTNMATALTVVPNPAKDLITISFTSNGVTNVPMQILSKDGKVFTEQNIKAVKGGNTIKVNISFLPNGLYIVKCNVNGTTLMQKLMVE